MKHQRPHYETVAKRREAGGFTLLEIMIVGVLTSVLMLGVWSLFRTWGRLYERGERRVQAAQLIRSLSDQFADDVRAVAFVMPRRTLTGNQSGSGSRASGSGSRGSDRQSTAGNQALVGGADWLVLEVLQTPNPFLITADDSGAEDDSSAKASLYAPELQRVIYTFQPPASDGLNSLSPGVEEMAAADDTELVGGSEEDRVEPFSGLLRMVVPVEQFEELAADDSDAGSSSRSLGLSDVVWQLRALVVGELDGSDTGATLGTQSTAPMGATSWDALGMIGQDKVAEVIWLEFRYFDGASWNSSWDSRAEGRLPVAVEMRFELKKERSADESVSADGETELVDDGFGDSDMASESMGAGSSLLGTSDMADASASEETPYYRCFVYLGPRAQRGK